MKTICPECGTKMVLTGSSFTPSTRPRRLPGPVDAGSVAIFTECPNSDCPGKTADLEADGGS